MGQHCPPRESRAGGLIKLRIEAGMVVVEAIATIRRVHFVGGKGIKTIARELGPSRNTAGKVLRSGEAFFVYEHEEQPEPRLGIRSALEAMLGSNAASSRRYRLTRI